MDITTASLPFVGVGSIWIAAAILHIVFASAVHNDAHELRKSGIEPALLSPLWWGIITLIAGLTGAAFYWVANRSTLRRPHG